jgi:superfamily II DNA helicase RecQ
MKAVQNTHEFGAGVTTIFRLSALSPEFAGQPTLAVLPTGLGKSLCYQ